MNNKIVSTKTKKTNSVFLAAVLVAGTVALLSPSFIGGAEAYSGQYGNDHNDKFKYKPTFDKSYGKSSAEYKKCININLNFPGLDFSPSFGPQGLGVDSLAREGGNNGPGPNGGHDGFKKFDKDGFVCINANDNSVRGGIDRGEEEPDECVTCFTRTLTEEEDLAAIIADFPIEEIDSLQDICNFIDENVQTGNLDSVSSALISAFNNAEVSDELLVELLNCLDEVYGVDFPRPE